MKRIFSVLLVLVLLLSTVPAVSAAGTAFWAGPEVVRAGDTITLTFYAGGGILGGNGSIQYDPAVLTLQGYSQSIGGDWVLEWVGNNFLFYDNSMKHPITGSAPIFQATFTVNAGAPVGSQVTVSAAGVTLSDGDQDAGIGTVTFSRTVAEPLSDNCNLAELSIVGTPMSPAFSPEITQYTAAVPFAVSAIGLNATAEHPGATVSIYNPPLTPGAVTAVQVTVTAENGAQKVYTIAVFREQDPNYVPSSNADLESLTVEGYPLSPVFSPEVTQYYVWLPYETDALNITAKAADAKASCTVADASSLAPGSRNDIAITVTAEDETQKVYTVTVIRAPSHDQVEDYLSGRLAPTEPEPTEPAQTEPPESQPTETEPTEPAVIPTTQPAETEPTEPADMASWLVCLLGFIAGAIVATLAAVFFRRRRHA